MVCHCWAMFLHVKISSDDIMCIPVCLSIASFQQHVFSFEWNVRILRTDQLHLGKHAFQAYWWEAGIWGFFSELLWWRCIYQRGVGGCTVILSKLSESRTITSQDWFSRTGKEKQNSSYANLQDSRARSDWQLTNNIDLIYGGTFFGQSVIYIIYDA